MLNIFAGVPQAAVRHLSSVAPSSAVRNFQLSVVTSYLLHTAHLRNSYVCWWIIKDWPQITPVCLRTHSASLPQYPRHKVPSPPRLPCCMFCRTVLVPPPRPGLGRGSVNLKWNVGSLVEQEAAGAGHNTSDDEATVIDTASSIQLKLL